MAVCVDGLVFKDTRIQMILVLILSAMVEKYLFQTKRFSRMTIHGVI